MTVALYKFCVLTDHPAYVMAVQVLDPTTALLSDVSNYVTVTSRRPARQPSVVWVVAVSMALGALLVVVTTVVAVLTACRETSLNITYKDKKRIIAN